MCKLIAVETQKLPEAEKTWGPLNYQKEVITRRVELFASIPHSLDEQQFYLQ